MFPRWRMEILAIDSVSWDIDWLAWEATCLACLHELVGRPGVLRVALRHGGHLLKGGAGLLQRRRLLARRRGQSVRGGGNFTDHFAEVLVHQVHACSHVADFGAAANLEGVAQVAAAHFTCQVQQLLHRPVDQSLKEEIDGEDQSQAANRSNQNALVAGRPRHLDRLLG